MLAAFKGDAFETELFVFFLAGDFLVLAKDSCSRISLSMVSLSSALISDQPSKSPGSWNGKIKYH